MAEVTLKQVGKDYPGFAGAVKDVNIDIADGEFLVLVGPSGCGKSTTLRMVAGLEEISSGTIAIGSRVVNDVAPKDRDIAMVFQNYALYPHKTVFQNMAFALKLRGQKRSEYEPRILETAKLLGIEKLLERRPGELSGGQRQRVAVGRAMVRKPAVYLFDEPLSNLDARLRVEMRAELKRLHQRLKTTTIYVTHDQEEAMTLGDRVVVMTGGSIQQCAPPLEIFERPVNRFVAGFLGTPPMNFIEGSLASDGPLTFTGGGLSITLPASLEYLRSTSQLTLGLRPEDLSVELIETVASDPLGATLDVVQPLGATADLSLSTGDGTALVARVQANAKFAPGSGCRLVFQSEALHFFEPGELGKRLNRD
jgi:multiple sugar transport system ATP-binding protein